MKKLIFILFLLCGCANINIQPNAKNPLDTLEVEGNVFYPNSFLTDDTLRGVFYIVTKDSIYIYCSKGIHVLQNKRYEVQEHKAPRFGIGIQ